MISASSSTQAPTTNTLNLMLARMKQGYLVRAWPAQLPSYLKACFDRYGEAYPLTLDLKELETSMKKANAEYSCIENQLGDIELTAEGEAAAILADWLATAFESSIRCR